MKEYKLEEVCNLITCGVAKRPDYFESGIPFLSSRNVKANRIILDQYKFISKEAHEELTKNNKPEKGDILYTRVGSFGEAAINNLDFEFSVFVSLTLIKPKHEIVNNKYLMYFLNSPVTQALAKKSTTGSGVQNLNVNTVREFKISLPSLSEQIRIAEILSQAESLIVQRKQSINLLDELLKSTFLEMFGDPVRNEKGWEIKTIEQLVKKGKQSIKRGPFGGALKKEIFIEKGFLVYEQFHALNNDFSFERYYISDEKFEELKAFEVFPDDIIISCSGVYLGKLAIIPKNAKRGIINQALLKISLDQKIINNKFFVFLFRHESFKNRFFGDVRGSGVPNFPPMPEFKKFQFIYPSIELQNKFVNIVEKVEALKTQYQQSLTELQNMYGVLSQKAFKGELSLDKVKQSI